MIRLVLAQSCDAANYWNTCSDGGSAVGWMVAVFVVIAGICWLVDRAK
jgi:hypothetical protein